MQTPPNSNNSRPNFMQFRKGESEQQFHRSEIMMKFGSKYHLYKKEMVPVLAERENITKIMNDMKKQLTFLDTTKWMFENNDQLPTDNFSPNAL